MEDIFDGVPHTEVCNEYARYIAIVFHAAFTQSRYLQTIVNFHVEDVRSEVSVSRLPNRLS